MVSNDVVYGCVLVFSLPLGFLVRRLDSSGKKFFTAAIGFFTLLVACRWDVLHGLLTIAVNCLILFLTSPRWCHVISFAWCFGYLAIFRTADWFGLPSPSPLTNAAQLLLTLRMVGLAFEVHDSHSTLHNLSSAQTNGRIESGQGVEVKSEKSKAEEEVKGASSEEAEEESELSLFKRFRCVNPSVVDVWCYAYSYMGLLTGPYYSFRTFIDFVHAAPVPWSATKMAMLQRLRVVPLCFLIFLLLAPNFKVSYADTAEFYTRPLCYRLLYMVPVFGACRARLYAAWLLAEAGCMAAGLGAYPASAMPKPGLGPAHLPALARTRRQGGETPWSFETVKNLELVPCELAPTLREVIRSWNMTVQFWMATNVYRRIPDKRLRQVITLTISAYWHGVHPGYFLSALTIPPVLLAESAMIAVYRKHLGVPAQRFFDLGCLFFRSRSIDYMCMGFMLLRLEPVWRYWSSVYFVIHVAAILLLLLAGLGRLLLPPLESKVVTNNNVDSTLAVSHSKATQRKDRKDL